MIFIDFGLLHGLIQNLILPNAKYLTYLLKSTEIIQIWEFDNLHMAQCAKIIVGFMANVANVFYPTFTSVFFIFSTFFTFFNVFLNFHLNVYYMYGVKCGIVLSSVVSYILVLFMLLTCLSTCVRLQTVFIRSVERNAMNMYEARRRILALSTETPPTDEQLADSCPHVHSNRRSPLLSSGKMLYLHCESKKGTSILLQMLTDFRNFSAVEFIKKFATN